MIQKIRQVFQGDKPVNEELKAAKPKEMPTTKDEEKDPGQGKRSGGYWQQTRAKSSVPRHVLRRRKWRSRRRKFQHIG